MYVKTSQVEQSPHLWWQTVGKFFTGINIAWQRVVLSVFLIRAMCWETSKDVWQNEIWVFNPVSVQWWSFIDNVVDCNFLRSFKAAFVELKKAMFTVATLFPMPTITTPGPHTQSKQSESFHAKSYLKVNCEKKCLW